MSTPVPAPAQSPSAGPSSTASEPQQEHSSLAAILPPQEQHDATRAATAPPKDDTMPSSPNPRSPRSTSVPPPGPIFDPTTSNDNEKSQGTHVSLPEVAYRPRRTNTRGEASYGPMTPGATTARPPHSHRPSFLDWVIPPNEVPVVEYTPRARTVGERLEPTLEIAHREKLKYSARATRNSLLLNTAIGVQVLLGALVTGLSSAISPGKAAVTTSVLGGLSTLVASYLARMRGSAEPELSITRTKDLEQFIRVAKAFQLDKGHLNGPEEEAKLEELRRKFEDLLGNASGERKLSPA